MAQFENVGVATTAVRALITDMRSVKGFRITNPVILDGVAKMASAIEAGKNIEVITTAEEVVSVGRSILGKFLRFSVFDKRTEGGVTIGRGRFLADLDELVAEKFDTDLLNRFKKLIEELQAAVSSETNGDFSCRIAAYNALHDFNVEVVTEQKRRDESRARKGRAEQAAKKAAATGKTTQAPNAERAAMLAAQAAERKAKAAELRGLLSL